MNASTLLLTAAGAHLLAVMSPGPDFAMVTRQTLAYGRRAGVWTAMGIATGLIFHVGWALFGLGWVVQRVPLLLDLLRYGGAAFLLYMGVSALRAAPPDSTPRPDDIPAQPARRSYLIGMATNLLNPKAMLYFVALCSALVTTATPVSQRLLLGAWILATTAAWFSLAAWSLGHPAIRSRLLGHAHWIDRGMGLLLIALGLLSLLA
ncbi:Threonine/homoserine/homoserine lactone efflux protein [Hydrocarboniphaga daqingensis]|uniref:Threonine/homoserine/homoserine lactone efflux protein n=1 Tax=Hydrocarboniphaga daqingensis TaxID=490188 RepID=A0A1M5K468_9GAMM|nr:LysE family transporter [Hydrocarboniphaga daqingensis]SHG47073.1 Threonine/homoserine/homoserine lactone efflux protein [Hydrocarboniphaga daqingensis]